MTRKIAKKINVNKDVDSTLRKQRDFYNKIINKIFNQPIPRNKTGFNLHIVESYGYSMEGTRCNIPVKGSQGNSVTMIAAISLEGLLVFSIFEGACNTAILKRSLAYELLPRIEENRTQIIMDNLSSHHSGIRRLEANGICDLCFCFHTEQSSIK